MQGSSGNKDIGNRLMDGVGGGRRSAKAEPRRMRESPGKWEERQPDISRDGKRPALERHLKPCVARVEEVLGGDGGK